MTADAARGRLLGRLPRLLPLELDLAGRPSRTATCASTLRHLAYTSGWKKLEPMWDFAIRSGQVHRFLPLLEMVLNGLAGPDARRPQPSTSPLSAREVG